MRRPVGVVHACAATLAFATICAFWLSTVVAELLLPAAGIAAVKHAIVLGLFVLVPALIVTGGSGAYLARERRGSLIEGKKRRMPRIAMLGLLVLAPCAVFLDFKAGRGELDLAFLVVQSVELVAGAIQLRWMALNARDGLRLVRTARTASSPGSG